MAQVHLLFTGMQIGVRLSSRRQKRSTLWQFWYYLHRNLNLYMSYFQLSALFLTPKSAASYMSLLFVQLLNAVCWRQSPRLVVSGCCLSTRKTVVHKTFGSPLRFLEKSTKTLSNFYARKICHAGPALINPQSAPLPTLLVLSFELLGLQLFMLQVQV